MQRKLEDAAYTTTEERMRQKGQGLLARLGSASLQLLQLAVVLGLLVLLPAFLHDGGMDLALPWQLYASYYAFFALGSVYRIIKYGRLAPRSSDVQVTASWASRLAFVVFVAVVPALHAAAMYRYAALKLYYSNALPASTTLYDVVGWAGVLAAVALNVAASRALGAAYNRIVAPEQLVTSGPYRFVQHPIYTSYMLLFFSYCLLLHSAPMGLMLLAVCMLHYGLRTALEHRVLLGAFGEAYAGYAMRTKRFLPGLI